MIKPQKEWTAEDIETFKKMAAAGTQAPAIGAALGRTPASIRGKARSLGVLLKRGGGPGAGFNPYARQIRGCERLEASIKTLFGRMPPRVVRAVLCEQPAPIPGTERIYKSASIERLAA